VTSDNRTMANFKRIGIIAVTLAGVLPLLTGIIIMVRINGEFRSGYICGEEPPTQEDLAARGSAVPICLDPVYNSSLEYGSIEDVPFCLQAGDLDKPPVWCSQSYEFKAVLWWSPCDKCGTAWRIYDTQDDDQSWYKQPTTTSLQPNSSTSPSADGWLKWTVREN